MQFRVGFICGKESDVVEEPQVLLPLEFVSGTFYLGAFLLFTGGWRRSTGVTALLEQRKIDARAAYVEILPLHLQLEPGLSAVKDKAENFVAVDPNASGLSPWPRGLVFDMAKHDDQSSQLSRYCAEMTAIVDSPFSLSAIAQSQQPQME